MITTIAQAIEIAANVFAAQPAAIEVEITMTFGSVWVGRDMQVFGAPRFAN